MKNNFHLYIYIIDGQNLKLIKNIILNEKMLFLYYGNLFYLIFIR